MIDFYASRRHYADHLRPIWDALRDEQRGTFYIWGSRGRPDDEAATACGPPHG